MVCVWMECSHTPVTALEPTSQETCAKTVSHRFIEIRQTRVGDMNCICLYVSVSKIIICSQMPEMLEQNLNHQNGVA